MSGVVRKLRVDSSCILMLPVFIFMAVVFVYPLLRILAESFAGGTFENYERVFSSSLYIRVIFQTFQISAIVTVICLVLGYCYAYALASAGRVLSVILLLALLLPFWVSLLVRTFSWIILLQDTGVINTTLLKLGVISAPLQLARNKVGVIIGMTHIMLPYATLPIYATLRKMEPNLMDAAFSCGASKFRAFRRVYFPLSLPGVVAAMLLTFTLALGFYVTPALLGGPRDAMIGQLIAAQVGEQLNFGFGSTLAVVLLLLTAGFFALFALVRLALNRTILRGAV